MLCCSSFLNSDMQLPPHGVSALYLHHSVRLHTCLVSNKCLFLPFLVYEVFLLFNLNLSPHHLNKCHLKESLEAEYGTYACNPNSTQEAGVGGLWIRGQPELTYWDPVSKPAKRRPGVFPVLHIFCLDTFKLLTEQLYLKLSNALFKEQMLTLTFL